MSQLMPPLRSSASLFTNPRVPLTSIWESPPCAFPPLFVLAGFFDQMHFCIPKMGFGVEGTFQRFYMTLTPMFSSTLNSKFALPVFWLFFFFMPPWGKYGLVVEIILHKWFSLCFAMRCSATVLHGIITVSLLWAPTLQQKDDNKTSEFHSGGCCHGIINLLL